MTNLPQSSTIPGLHFTLSTPLSSRFGPRLGSAILRRPNGQDLQIPTPGLLTSTSRGVVPHLSRDHYSLTKAIRWVHIPFETFLEHSPPVPTLQGSTNPLHKFLGYTPAEHVLSMSARDPSDGREMPANGTTHISAYSLRGVRKVTPADWRAYTTACQPDIVFALTDTPFTHPPYSQKRLTKSLERSTAWLMDLLQSHASPFPSIFVHMAGATSIPARRAFAESLTERLYGKEAEVVAPLRCLDDGVTGYTFDLVPLRLSLEAVATSELTKITTHTSHIVPLLKTSLSSLPTAKLRLVYSPQSPHEILRLTQHVGIDLFDAHWAQRAADIGIALDFRFPVANSNLGGSEKRNLHLGHNLYHSNYAFDFGALSDTFSGAAAPVVGSDVCLCTACSPVVPATRISHGCDPTEAAVIGSGDGKTEYKPNFTRAYLHHLLHTHEMSAHSLLVMHNLSVLDAFFAGIRSVIKEKGKDGYRTEAEAFENEYDEGLEVFEEARTSWKEVELARGKGRLAREKAKQEDSTLGTAVDISIASAA